MLAFVAPAALAQQSLFSSFTPLAASVATGSLPEATPFQFGNAAWTQLSIADRTTQLAAGQFNTGSWDMIDSNRSGPDAGRYLFTVFETGQAGVQRTDLWTGKTQTVWASPAAAPALNSHVAFDASRWTPFVHLPYGRRVLGQPAAALRPPVRTAEPDLGARGRHGLHAPERHRPRLA